MRLSKEELDKIAAEAGKYGLWSYSRFSTYRTSPYEYFLSYIKHEDPETEVVSAYAGLGGAAHDILENLYEGGCELTNEEMFEKWNEDWVYNVDFIGAKFNRADDEKNQWLQERYKENVDLFFMNYKPIPYKVYCEKHVVIKVGEVTFHGYIDAAFQKEDGTVEICDFKTSTIFTGKQVDLHAHQLALYAEGMRQMGVPKEKIKCYFNFLKYATVYRLKADGKGWIQGTYERRLIGQKLSSKITSWCKRLKYSEEEINAAVAQAMTDNGIDNLPEELKSKFRIECARIYIDDPFAIFDSFKDEAEETIKEIYEKTKLYEETHDETIFYDSEEQLKENSYYLSMITDYSISQLKPYAEYLKRKEEEQTANEDLLGVTNKANASDNWESSLDALFS